MDHTTIQARKALMAGREPEKNLPVYLKGVAGAYYRMANFNLAMQYATFAGAFSGHGLFFGEEEDLYAKQLKELLMQYVSGMVTPELSEEGLKKLLALRTEFIDRMQVLTAYTDKLYLHEYVLKRLAPGMEHTEEEIDSNDAVNELTGFLFHEGRKDYLRENLSYVISELPIRMTKARFFEWVKQTSAAFRESDAESLNRSFYMLYSAAGLLEPLGMERFAELKTALEYFDTLDYRSMTEEKYEEAKVMLETVTEHLSGFSDSYCSMMELINSMTSIFLMLPFVSPEDEKSVGCCINALKLSLREEPATEEELMEAFSALEGVPEELETELLAEEGILSEFPVKDSLIEAMMQKVLFSRIQYAKQLHTTSLFVNPEETFEKVEFDEEIEKFCKILSEKMDQGQKAMNRARMAQVLYHLPVPFTKSSDVQSYMMSTLDNCHDASEKTAAMRIIRGFAEER